MPVIIEKLAVKSEEVLIVDFFNKQSEHLTEVLDVLLISEFALFEVAAEVKNKAEKERVSFFINHESNLPYSMKKSFVIALLKLQPKIIKNGRQDIIIHDVLNEKNLV